MPLSHAVFLRGVNVGKTARVKMDRLVAVLKQDGLEVERTVLQSGNVIVSNWTTSTVELAERVRHSLEERLGLSVGAVALGAKDLRTIVRSNPLSLGDVDLTRWIVVLCAPKLSSKEFAQLVPLLKSPNEVALGAGMVHQWCPEGVSSVQALQPLVERQFSFAATARNMRVLRLVAEHFE